MPETPKKTLIINTLTKAQYNTSTKADDELWFITDAVETIEQYETLPTASADLVNRIVQYSGTTDTNYTNGYFYKCISDGQTPATYSWTQINVQPNATGGTWGSITGTLSNQTDLQTALNAKQNTLTAGSNITISGNTISAADTTYIAGTNITIGSNKSINVDGNVVRVGDKISVLYDDTSTYRPIDLADKANSAVEADHLIGQIATITEINRLRGLSTNIVTALNAKQDTLVSGTNIKTINSNSILGSGNLQIDSLPSQSGQSGKFLTTNGTAASWANVVQQRSITLLSGSWVNKTLTVAVSGVTATNLVMVSPDPNQVSVYAGYGIVCASQSAGYLIFTCATTPTININVNVAVFNN